ncbi:protein kinase [Actinoplanes sp. TRM 88003]|uniref:non-specific serine/threonine protein kinase n=1 Tax=Paractinoplanes aksuensis TaxID=2939490 RepID=A0ABT1DT18_9ACTN|nr:serine/threonine protein kinase [Actinoplanes aksuensis]MCO8273994.1 protein kinase [Actinoplanes aksuensis]
MLRIDHGHDGVAARANGEVAVQKLAGRYRVGEVLGQGGSAVVRYGFDSVLKRPVAIKMFDVSATGVLLEARTAAGLSHPNIAQVYDYGEIVDSDTRTPYLVMEFVGGETLADLIARTGALRWRRAAEIAAETASALAVAHAQNLVHRDVNPRNIMLTPDGVKVLDFGIAAVAGQPAIDANGALWGSPAYLAPEQLRGEPSYPAADVYGLGLLLFESLTGARAWPGEHVGAVLAARHDRPAPRLPRLAGVPRELVRLYEAATTEDPDARPAAVELAELFRRAGRPAPLTRQVRPVATIRPADQSAVLLPAPVTSRQRSRRRALVVGSAAVIAAIVSVVGVQLANGTVTPGGREAEAAVEGPRPVATSPQTSRPTPSPSASVRVRETTETTTTQVRKKTPKTRTTKAPSSAPTTKAPSSAPTSPPATTKPPVKPTPTDDETTPPVEPTEPTVEPTDPGTTEPTEPTPPTTTTDPATTGDDNQRSLV